MRRPAWVDRRAPTAASDALGPRVDAIETAVQALTTSVAALDSRLTGLEPPAVASVVLPGFGSISAECGRVAAALGERQPKVLSGTVLDFGSRPYQPTDEPQLTPGSRRLMAASSSGGSSRLSEAFAFEVLARCEGAALVKTRSEVTYAGTTGAIDCTIQVGRIRVGVSATRAVAFPRGSAYPVSTADSVLRQALTRANASSANVTQADAWAKTLLVVMTYDPLIAATVAEAWNRLPSSLGGDTILYLVVTAGADQSLYA